MSKMIKRTVGLVLAVCIVGSLVVSPAAATSTDAIQQSLEALKVDFPSGSYFTTDGKKGSSGEFTKVAKARGVDIGSDWTGAWTCVGFSKYAWAKIFGIESTNEANRKEIGIGRAGISSTWKSAKVGDLVYFYKNSDCKVHSKAENSYVKDPHVHAAIIFGLSDTGVTLLDCNYVGTNQIGLYTANFGGGWPKSYCRIFRATNYDDVAGTKTYTVTFDPTGGYVSPATKTVTEGTTLYGLPEPTRDGYEFIHWSTAPPTTSGMVVSDGVLEVNQDQTLYAIWRLLACEHSYNDDVCSKCGEKLPYDNGFDSNAEGLYRAITNTAYVYTGPYMNTEHIATIPMGDTVYVEGAVINSYGNKWLKTSDGYYTYADKLELCVGEVGDVEEPPMGSDDVSTTPQYTVILDTGSVCRQITVTNGSTYGYLPEIFKEGYTFDGWYTASGVRITSSTTVNLTGDQTLYARWTEDKPIIIEPIVTDWSEWSTTPVYSSSTREVRTREVKVSDEYTEYRYGRYVNSTGGHDCWCAKYLEGLSYVSGYAVLDYSNWSTTRYSSNGKGWTCGRCNASHTGVDHVGTDGRSWWAEYVLPGGSYYWEETRVVPATYRTEYSYRDLIQP